MISEARLSKTSWARDAGLVMLDFCCHSRTPAFLPQVLMSTRHQFLQALNHEEGDGAVLCIKEYWGYELPRSAADQALWRPLGV